METVGVITGDIVSSSKSKKPKELIQQLSAIIAEIKQQSSGKDIDFDVYRGDSFQGLFKDPGYTLNAAIIIRAGLRSYNKNVKKMDELIDARISIGIGSMEFNTNEVKTSGGQAFEWSGRALDKMKKNDDRLVVHTPWEKINDELATSCKLADAIITDWSFYSSEIAYYKLQYKNQNKEIAEQLKISSSAISKRIKHGHIEAIDQFILRFHDIINQKINQEQ